MEKFINRFDGEQSPQHTPRDEFAHLSNNSLPSSTPQEETPARLPLPADWFRKDQQELLQELGQLSKAELLTTLVAVLGQGPLPGKTHNDRETPRGVEANTEASTPSGSAWGPEYNTRQLAQMSRVSRQAIALRVHNLVTRGWLEPRCTARWTFDEEEAQIILRNPHNRGPLKKRPSRAENPPLEC